MSKFKEAKVWTPLVGTVALVAAWYTGVAVPEAEVVDAANTAAQGVSVIEYLYLSGAGLGVLVAGWFGFKKK